MQILSLFHFYPGPIDKPVYKTSMWMDSEKY